MLPVALLIAVCAAGDEGELATRLAVDVCPRNYRLELIDTAGAERVVDRRFDSGVHLDAGIGTLFPTDDGRGAAFSIEAVLTGGVDEDDLVRASRVGWGFVVGIQSSPRKAVDAGLFFEGLWCVRFLDLDPALQAHDRHPAMRGCDVGVTGRLTFGGARGGPRLGVFGGWAYGSAYNERDDDRRVELRTWGPVVGVLLAHRW
jgi:hypothetical protein